MGLRPVPVRSPICRRSCCCATVRASGTPRTSSPAGWTSTSPTRASAEASAAVSCCATRALLPDVVHTSVLRRAIRTAELALDGVRPALDPGAPVVAAQRAALRRPAGQGQEADAGGVRRGAVHAVAPLVRHPAAAAARRRRVLARSATRATRGCRRSWCRAPSASRTSSSGCCRTGTTRSSPTCWPGRTVLVTAHGNSLRALVKHLDGISDDDDRRAEHPDRHPAALRARRRAAPGRRRGRVPRPGGGGGRHQGRRHPGPLASPADVATERAPFPRDARGTLCLRSARRGGGLSGDQVDHAAGKDTAWSAKRS